MNNENNILKQESSHNLFAKEVSQRLIHEFGSKEQSEFIIILKKEISNDYESKLKECRAHLKCIENNYDNFLGNPPKQG